MSSSWCEPGSALLAMIAGIVHIKRTDVESV
jgi:hypothetical protein